MADTIERTIYKLELDDSGYLRGVESLTASTKKFTLEQEAANKVLQTNQTNLKNQSAYVRQTKKDLEDYTGTNEKHRLQLQKSFQTATADQKKLTDTVFQNIQAYNDATKAAQDFANTSARATQLQQQTTGGKIPTGPAPGVPAQITSQIANVLNVPEFTAMAQVVEQTKAEFDDLAVSVGLAEARMQQLNVTDEEFKQLAPVVAKGKEALQQYDKAAKSSGDSQGSLRTQLRLGREELVKLEQAGKGATAQYFELEKRVAKLTDEFGDQQQRIKILASDTKLLDFGKGAITAATSAFQAYTAVSILAGDESAELQKKTMQLFAAMQLLQSLEQLSNLTRREGVLATLAQSGAQTLYTAVVGASTGALKAFRLALAATGIGAAIVLIGYLVSKYLEYRDAVKKAGEQQKLLSEVIAEANKEAGKQIADLKILTQAVQDANIPMKERLEAVKQLQKEFPDYFSNLSKEAILTGDITAATKLATEAIIAASRARAAKGKIDAIENQRLDLEFQKQKVINATTREQARVTKDQVFQAAPSSTVGQGIGGAGPAPSISIEQQKKNIQLRRNNALADIKDKDDTLARQAEFLIKFVGLDKIAKTIEDPDKDKKAKATKEIKEIQNEFARKKAELDQQLAELTRKESDNESKIRIEFAARLAKEQLEIEKLLKAKKLTKPQAGILDAEAIQINTLALENALKEFNKKQTDARAKLNDDLQNLQNKATQDTLNLIQNEFDRRAQLIDFNEQKELENTKENTQKRLDSLEFDRLLIGEKAYQDAKAILISTGEQNALNIIQRFANERKNLSADVFQSLLGSYTQAIANADLVFTEEESKAIRSIADKFNAGKISYEKFQKDIDKIKKDAERNRLESSLVVQKDELQAIDHQLASIEDKYSEHYKKLKKQRDDLAKDIAQKEITVATDVQDPNKKQVDSVQQYAEAIGQITDSIIQFWQAANDAEAKALDRSISLQEKRVSAAQRIAERGNAQYLKAEEDRLTELNVKRENAARKQLGIDAALQASQILVGITGAISKIATPGIGIAETIAAMAVIFGALAAGYGLVKSLQGNQPKLFKGTPHVERRGQPAGRDTIPAWLNEGEAVIPTEKNKKYKKSVEAIYHGKVPAEVLNTFVENYVRNKSEKSKKDEKKTFEKKELIVHKVYNETSDKKITAREIKELLSHKRQSFEKKQSDFFVNNYTKNIEERKAFNATKSVFDEVKNRLENIKSVDKTYSEVIDKVFKENKKLVESKNTHELARKVSLTLTENKVSAKRMDSFINSYAKNIEETKALDIIKTITELVNYNIDKKSLSLDARKSLTNKNVSISDVQKYSSIINKVAGENRELTESKNVFGIVSKVVSEVYDKKINVKQLSSFVNNYTKQLDDKKTFNVIQTISKLINEKVAKNVITSDFQNKLVNENITIDDIRKYSEVINKIVENKKDITHKSTYEQFVDNVSKVPARVLNKFIENYSSQNFTKNYEERKFFKGTPELKGVKGIDKIPIWATGGEAIIPADKNSIYKPVINAVFEGAIPPEHLNNFVNNYHSIKSIPLPDYQKIKETAELKIGYDGRMAVAVSEQNKLIVENTEVQKQVLRAVKTMGVHFNWDKNGVELSLMEALDKRKIDERI